jgi:hypothetical protein
MELNLSKLILTLFNSVKLNLTEFVITSFNLTSINPI